MTLTAEGKNQIIQKYQSHEGDTGSSEVQIALLTERLNYLTDHFKTHSKDQNSTPGIISLENRTINLLYNFKKGKIKRYQAIISDLGIRR